MRRDHWSQRTKLKVRIGISGVVLVASLVIILGKYPDDSTKWAFGIAGLVIGYWLR